ncbi:MAG TPA: xanthine dehydrogenase family protein subunit M [Thermomicrobiales bacterium]|nr:xanthine dehydrogenase family protein subunit M [Thermomicrobiales bacterium]
MYPAAFSYHRAESVADAIAILGENPDAKVLAGGHSLIPAMKLRLAAPGMLIDIGRIDELKGVNLTDGVTFGALATYNDMRDADGIAENYPIIDDAVRRIGDPQVRAHGTIGGTLAHSDPAADLTAVMLALGAEVVATGPNGERTISTEELFVDLWTTSLGIDELITSVRVPPLPGNSVMAYEKHSHPASGYAVAGVAVVVSSDGSKVTSARICVTGATSKATHARSAEATLIGQPLTDTTIQAAAQLAPEGLEINGDYYASEAYRAQLIRVLTRKALERALARASGTNA